MTVTGLDNTTLGSGAATVTLTAADGGYTGASATVAVTVIDDDAALILSTDTLTIDEGTEGALNVRLSTQPTGTVTVTLTSSDTGAATVSPATLAFTADDYQTPKPVTVTALQDNDAADESVTVSLSPSGGDYGNARADVSVSITDDETAGIAVSVSSLALTEGGTNTFTVALTTEPTAEVTVTVTSGDTGAVTVSPAQLTFTTTNWATAQTVTLTGVQDDDDTHETVTVSMSATGGDYQGVTSTVTARVADDEAAAIVVSVLSLTLAEGASDTFDVVLTKPPTATVTVAVTVAADDDNDNAAATVTPALLTFTTANYNTAQTVTVTATEDAGAGDRNTMIDLAATSTDSDYSGLTAQVALTVTDDDAALVVSATTVQATENRPAETFTVNLAARPTSNVIVTITSSDPESVRVIPSTMTFTPLAHARTQTVNLVTPNDDDANDERVTVTLTSSGGGYDGLSRTVTVNVTDDDTAGFVLSDDDLTVPEGTSTTFTVALATQPDSTVTVTVASADTTAASVNEQTPGDPVVLTFSPDSYTQAQTVTVTGVSDTNLGHKSTTLNLTASGGGYSGITGTVNVAVTDDDAAIEVSTASLTIIEGETATFDVTLKSPPTGQVTISVASTNPFAAIVLPETLTFSADNSTVAQTITVAALEDTNTSNAVLRVTLTGSGGGYGAITNRVNVTVLDNDTPVLPPIGPPPPIFGPAPTLEACDSPAIPDPGFGDVDPRGVHYPGIRCVAYYGITKGTGDGTTFDPWSSVSRFQMALFMLRLAQVTGVTLNEGSADQFEDLGNLFEEGRNAIGMLVASGLLRGRSETRFEPYAPMTRSQMAIMMARLLRRQGTYTWSDRSNFVDVDAIVPQEHQQAITLLHELGIVQGFVGRTHFGPYQPVTRAQMATIMARLLDSELPPVTRLF